MVRLGLLLRTRSHGEPVIEVPGARTVDGGAAVGHRHDPVALAFEGLPQRLAQRRLVITHEVCRELRERRNGVAVIMLTALDSEADAVLGLEAGADDYVVKPFRPAELRSRIPAV